MTTVLHIGLPKTGTTYLQEWAKLNRETLLQNGIGVLSSEASHRLATASITDPEIIARADVIAINQACSLTEAMDEIKHLGGEANLVSSEYFFTCEPSQVRAAMDDAGVSVAKIICFLRRQDRACAAGYAQEVKALGSSKRIADYGDPVYTHLLDWNDLHDQWEKAFPDAKIIFENYDACRRGGAPLLQTFMAAIEATADDAVDVPVRVNESLSAHLTELARMMNENGQRFDLQLLLEIQSKTKLPPFDFDKKVTRLFQEIYLPGNLKLAERFPGKFEDFCDDMWIPSGIDLTDKLDAKQQEAIIRYVALP